MTGRADRLSLPLNLPPESGRLRRVAPVRPVKEGRETWRSAAHVTQTSWMSYDDQFDDLDELGLPVAGVPDRRADATRLAEIAARPKGARPARPSAVLAGTRSLYA